MGSRIECFMVEETDRAKQSLRRFTFGEGSTRAKACPKPGTYGHHAIVPIEDGPLVRTADGYINIGDGYPHDDPRWPKTCEACGYAFVVDDQWHLFIDPIHRAADGREWPRRELPAGAMYFSDWAKIWGTGPDGHSIVCVLPPATGDIDHWQVDGPAKGGGHWTRTGVAPVITASPSILTPNYHGFLRAGFLEEC